MHYSYNDIKSYLESIVETKGKDYIYTQRLREGYSFPGCEYAWQGKPDCIIGHLLVELGISIDNLGEDKDFGSGIIQDYEYKLEAKYGITFDSKAMALMGGIQNDQDNGISWGEAFSMNTRYIDRHGAQY